MVNAAVAILRCRRSLARNKRSVGGRSNAINQTSNDLLALFDNAPLNRRYWTIFILMSAVFVFDFFVVACPIAAVAREWHLT